MVWVEHRRVVNGKSGGGPAVGNRKLIIIILISIRLLQIRIHVCLFNVKFNC